MVISIAILKRDTDSDGSSNRHSTVHNYRKRSKCCDTQGVVTLIVIARK